MLNTHSSKGKYILATLVGAAAGGLVVALSTRAVPEIMSGMMDGMMHNMMPEMMEADSGAGDMCKRMMAGMGHAPQHAASHSKGGISHGIH